MGLVDWVLLALLGLALILAVRKTITDARRGRRCCGDCAGCAARCGNTPKGEHKP